MPAGATSTGNRSGKETLLVADALAGAVFAGHEGYEKGRVLAGGELVGWRYEPLFSFRPPSGGAAHAVVPADFVTLDTGTGIVHIAPAFGADDNRLAREAGLAFLQLVEPDGTFARDAGELVGMNFKAADKPITRSLKERGLLFHQSTVRHDYPFCPRATRRLPHPVRAPLMVHPHEHGEGARAREQRARALAARAHPRRTDGQQSL